MDLRLKRAAKIRILPAPEAGLRALLERAPQAEAMAQRAVEKLRPELTWLYGSRRRLATLGVAVFTGWLFVHVMFGANGMVIYRGKKAEYQGLQKEVEGLQKENDRYSGQIKALKTDPKTIEKEAREQLQYARPGEVVYVAPAPAPAAPPPATHAARK
jgi:cell division protein FtsB